jgi:hypothetical protein
MPRPIEDFASTLRTVIAWIYGFSALLFAGALALAGYRLCQRYTLTAVQAEVLQSELDSYIDRSTGTDSDGFTEETAARIYVPIALVHYQFKGQIYTVEARSHSGSSFRSIELRTLERWKPGTRIRVYIDPAAPDKPRPDVGLNLHTLQPSLGLILAALFVAALAWVLDRFLSAAFRALAHHLP